MTDELNKPTVTLITLLTCIWFFRLMKEEDAKKNTFLKKDFLGSHLKVHMVLQVGIHVQKALQVFRRLDWTDMTNRCSLITMFLTRWKRRHSARTRFLLQ